MDSSEDGTRAERGRYSVAGVIWTDRGAGVGVGLVRRAGLGSVKSDRGDAEGEVRRRGGDGAGDPTKPRQQYRAASSSASRASRACVASARSQRSEATVSRSSSASLERRS